MLKMVCKLLIFVLLCLTFSRGTDITFKNVTIKFFNTSERDGEESLEELEETRIPFSNSLKDFLPKIEKIKYDLIEIKRQRIPVLYEDSLADLGLKHPLKIINSRVHEIRPGALKNSRFLDELSLAGNDLEEIREGVFNHIVLKRLDLSHNKISSIEDGAFDNMAELVEINLEKNKIAAWNKNWFQNTPMLYVIVMESNFIEELPQEAFKNLKGNREEFAFLFNRNKIKTIHPEAFKGIAEIRALQLEYNLLQNFDGNCITNVHVGILFIGNNNIVCLQGDYETIFQAQITYIDGNPFDCECWNKIKIWVEENKKYGVKYSHANKNCAFNATKL